jgi:hypothetical protein
MADHEDTREPDFEHVREALGEAGERSLRVTRPGLHPKRDREARERLAATQTRRDPPCDANGGMGGPRPGDEDGALGRPRRRAPRTLGGPLSAGGREDAAA